MSTVDGRTRRFELSSTHREKEMAVPQRLGRRRSEWSVLLLRWAWVAVLLVGWALYELVRAAVVDTGNPNLLPALILLGAAVVPAAFVVFISARRLVFGVRGLLVGASAVLGGVVGVVTAGLLEYDTIRGLGVASMLGVGLIEEAAKLIVPAATLVLVRRNRHAADGLLLGVASGAGFAALETMGYAFVALAVTRGDLAVVNTVLFDRGVLSPAAHMAWTGLSAAALWAAAVDHWRLRSVTRFVGAYLLVAVLHAVWDSVGTTWSYALVAVISLGLLTVTTYRLARRRPWHPHLWPRATGPFTGVSDGSSGPGLPAAAAQPR